MRPHCASHFIFLAEKNHKRRRASSIIIGKTLPCSISNRQYVLITPFLLRWSTFVQAVDSWLLDHVIYLKKITVVKAEKILNISSGSEANITTPCEMEIFNFLWLIWDHFIPLATT